MTMTTSNKTVMTMAVTVGHPQVVEVTGAQATAETVAEVVEVMMEAMGTMTILTNVSNHDTHHHGNVNPKRTNVDRNVHAMMMVAVATATEEMMTMEMDLIPIRLQLVSEELAVTNAQRTSSSTTFLDLRESRNGKWVHVN